MSPDKYHKLVSYEAVLSINCCLAHLRECSTPYAELTNTMATVDATEGPGSTRYDYVPLDHSIKETRLAELLPGDYEDDICFKLHHVALSSISASRLDQSSVNVEHLQKELPKDWKVRETLNGRFIFEKRKKYEPQEPYETSWVHPTAHIEPMPNNYNLIHTKPEYEALSHVWGPEEEKTVVYIDGILRATNSAAAKHEEAAQSPALGHTQNIKRKRTTDDDGTRQNSKHAHNDSEYSQARDRTAVTYGVLESPLIAGAATNSMVPQHTLRIRSELATALRHLRQKKRSRMLWVDNICIDQTNTTERSHLVRHMGQIYRLARNVIVWLGPETDNSKLAMSKLEYLGRQIELTDKGSWRVNAPKCLEPTWSRTPVPLPYDDETWTAIRHLLQRPWFRRLWVWQEAKLSNDDSFIQCGHKRMELYRFGAAVACIAAKVSIVHSVPADLEVPLFRAGDAVLRQFDEPFLNTLLHLNSKECYDPRDKIYGALGLAPPGMAERIAPDYEKDVEEVYTDATIAHFQMTDRVDFLLACDLDGRSLPGPSWVPDWSVVQRQTPRWLLSATLASGVSVSTAEVVRTPKPSLRLQGVEWGTVSHVASRAPNTTDSLEALKSVIKSWAPHDWNVRRYASGKESFADAFVKTVHWNTLKERCPFDHGLLTLSEAKSAMQSNLGSSLQAEPACIGGNPVSRVPTPRYREARGRCYVVLDNEYIGMTSAAVEETDVVCVVLGCPLPMILRPHSSGRFQVVGTTYIHGLMDAEGILGPLPPDYVVEVGASSGWYGGFTFRNIKTKISAEEDPRLGNLSPSWTRMDAVRTAEDPLHFVRYRNMATGKIINGDPRLLPEALRARGVPLKPLNLA